MRKPHVVQFRCRWSISKFSSDGSFGGVFSDGFDDALQMRSGEVPKIFNGFLGNIYGEVVVIEGGFRKPSLLS